MHCHFKNKVYRRCMNLCTLAVLSVYPQLADAQRSFIEYRTPSSNDSALVVEVEQMSKTNAEASLTKKQTSMIIPPDGIIIDSDNPTNEPEAPMVSGN